jgi:hypothetical protein
VGPKATRMVRVSVLFVAGAADTLASLDALELLVERGVVALSPLSRSGWTQPSVTAARAAEVFGAIYLVAEAELASIVTLTGDTP